MAKTPSTAPSALAVVGVMAVCFFGILCLYHLAYWVFQALAFHSDKAVVSTRIAIWLALVAGAAFTWYRLVRMMYFPKKTDKTDKN